jgi:integrase
MTRRARGEGGLRWDEPRQRWIATKDIGYDGRGKRIVRKATGRTQAEARKRLKEVLRAHEDGLAVEAASYTVKQAVEDWLTYGLGKQGASTVKKYRILCNKHIIPLLGARKLRDLTAREVEAWLLGRSKVLSTEALHRTLGCLNRAVRRAMAQDLVRRNVVDVAEVPRGRVGRPSKSLTPDQVDAVLTLTVSDRLHNDVVLSLPTGARTEELRALRWEHVHLDHVGSVPPHIEVWRSVREDGDTKTRKSRRTLALPARCVDALRKQRALQAGERLAAGERWRDTGFVFTTRFGTAMDAANVRRGFRRRWLWCRACRPRIGRRGSYGTRSSRSSRTPAFPSRRFRSWSGTAGRR